MTPLWLYAQTPYTYRRTAFERDLDDVSAWRCDAAPSVNTLPRMNPQTTPVVIDLGKTKSTVVEVDDYNPPSQWQWNRKTIRYRTVNYEALFFGQLPVKTNQT